MKIITIIGARPQFVKAAVVSRAIQEHNEKHQGKYIDEIIIHTGQHYDAAMSDVFFSEMKIPLPKYNLHIGGGRHGAMTGRMMEKIELVLVDEHPDMVLVYGDTNSTLAGALVAAKLHIPVAHVEAGVRSFNMDIPEEINRILADRISTWLFCPSQTGVSNLQKEGFASLGMHVEYVGDVMYDALLYYQKIAVPTPTVRKILDSHSMFYLATVHRAGNTDDPVRLRSIFSALEEISASIPVILPLHPRTKKIIAEQGIAVRNIMLIEPVGYFDMISLLKRCQGVFTDSGGLQKESYFLEKPCVMLLDETPWPELVKQGCNVLTGASYEHILTAQRSFNEKSFDFSARLYGDGRAGSKIIKALIK